MSGCISFIQSPELRCAQPWEVEIVSDDNEAERPNRNYVSIAHLGLASQLEYIA